MQHTYVGIMNLHFPFVVYDICFRWLYCYTSERLVLRSKGLPPSTLLHIDLPIEASGYKTVFLRLWAKE